MLPPRQHQLYRALRDYLGWKRGDLAEAVADVTERNTPSVRTIEDYETGKRKVAADPPLRALQQVVKVNAPAPKPVDTEASYEARLRLLRAHGVELSEPVTIWGAAEWQELHSVVAPAVDFDWDNPRRRDASGEVKRARLTGQTARADRALSRAAIDYALGLGLYGPRVWLASYEVVRLLPSAGAKKRPKGGPSPFEPYDPPVRFGGSLEDRDRADDHAATLGPDAVVLLRPRDGE